MLGGARVREGDLAWVSACVVSSHVCVKLRLVCECELCAIFCYKSFYDPHDEHMREHTCDENAN